MFVSGNDINIVNNVGQEITIQVLKDTLKLKLNKAWGRICEPNVAWVENGEKLPTVSMSSGENWVEAVITITPKKNEFIRIYEFELDLTGAPDWSDNDGKKTFLRCNSKWQPISELLASHKEFPSKWAWPIGSGLLSHSFKKSSAYSMGAQDMYTGFSKDFFIGIPDPLATIDFGAIAYTDKSDHALTIVTNQAIALSYTNMGKTSICGLIRDLKAGQEYSIKVKITLSKKNTLALNDSVVPVFENTPLRVIFMGDSVGAASGSYASQLTTKLNDEYSKKVWCLNASVGGSTTESALSRFNGDALDYQPNLIVLQLAYNDVGRIKPEIVAANLKKMIDPILAMPNGRAVVITPLSYDKKRVDETMLKGTDINKIHLEDYIPALQKMVAEYESDLKTKGKIAFVDIWNAMSKVRKEKGVDFVLLPDGSHPNEECNKIITEAIWPELKNQADTVIKVMQKR